MKLAFVAHRIARVGGMERAAAEVAQHLADRHEMALVTTLTDLPDGKVEKRMVHVPKLPAVLRSYVFRHKARKQMRELEPATFLTIGAAAWPVDIMVVQFCHAAFWKLGATARPDTFYQRLAGTAFKREEATAVRSPRLKGMIAVSKGVAQEMVDCYNYPAERIKIVPNGVDIDIFHPVSGERKAQLRREHGIGEKGLLAVFVGGDWTRKGVGFALEAIKGVRDARLLVVGEGGAERSKYQQMAADLGLQDRVVFAGHSDRPWEWYQMADVCVQPTHYEAFSLVSLEAAAAGLPLLIPDVNGARDLVRDGHNGFICARSADNIREILIRLDNDRVQLAEMGSHAREVGVGFSWPAVSAEFEKALTDLLASKQTKGEYRASV